MEQIPASQFSLTNLTVKPRTEFDRVEWDAFAERSPYAWLYHTFDMQDAIATWPGKSDVSFALVDEEKSGEIVTTIPLHRLNRPFLKLFPNWLKRKIMFSMNVPAALSGSIACVAETT